MLGDVQKVDSSLESTRAIRTSIAKSLPLESTTALESTFKKWILLPSDIVFISLFLVFIERRQHPAPFRTWQLSFSSPMILHLSGVGM